MMTEPYGQSIVIDELTISFVMRCDDAGLSHQQGVELAEKLADEILQVAEDRQVTV